MNLIGKIFAALIVVASLGFLYLASMLLSAESSWQQLVRAKEKALEQTRAETDLLEHGGDNARLAIYRPENGPPKTDPADPADRLGVDQYKLLLDALILDKGRVWQARRGGLTPAGDVTLLVEKPSPANIKDKLMLYAFEAKSIREGGAYLGAFKASAPAGQNLTLVPAVQLQQAELGRLAQSDSAWLLYEVMPLDRKWTFAGMTDEQLTAMLPESIRGEYLQAGKPKDYQRPLRAYNIAFRDLRSSIAATLDAIASRTVDNAHVKQSLDGTTAQVQARDTEIASLEAELKRTTAERDAVTGQVTTFQTKLADLQNETARLLADNKQMAERLAAAEFAALRRVDELSRAPQAGTP